MVRVVGRHLVPERLDALGGHRSRTRRAVAVEHEHSVLLLGGLRGVRNGRRVAVARGGQHSVRAFVHDVLFGGRQPLIDAGHHLLPLVDVVDFVPDVVDVLGRGGLHGRVDVGGRIEPLHGLGQSDDIGDLEVGGDVLGKRLHRAGHGGHIGGEQLLRDGRQHETLVRRAERVAVAVLLVRVARPAQDERLVAVERLKALVQMAARIGVVDGHGHVHFHAAERVHDVFEAVEVDLGIMRDGNARQLGHRLYGQGRPADCVRGVEFVLTVLAHVNQRVAMQGHERHLLVHRVDAGEHDAVAAELVASELLGRFALVRPVGAHEQQIERLVDEIGLRERGAQIVVDAIVQVARQDGVVGERGTRPSEDEHRRHRQRDERRAAALVRTGALVLAARHAARRGAAIRPSLRARVRRGRAIGTRRKSRPGKRGCFICRSLMTNARVGRCASGIGRRAAGARGVAAAVFHTAMVPAAHPSRKCSPAFPRKSP